MNKCICNIYMSFLFKKYTYNCNNKIKLRLKNRQIKPNNIKKMEWGHINTKQQKYKKRTKSRIHKIHMNLNVVLFSTLVVDRDGK